jgi:hypothetical protein
MKRLKLCLLLAAPLAACGSQLDPESGAGPKPGQEPVTTQQAAVVQTIHQWMIGASGSLSGKGTYCLDTINGGTTAGTELTWARCNQARTTQDWPLQQLNTPPHTFSLHNLIYSGANPAMCIGGLGNPALTPCNIADSTQFMTAGNWGVIANGDQCFQDIDKDASGNPITGSVIRYGSCNGPSETPFQGAGFDTAFRTEQIGPNGRQMYLTLVFSGDQALLQSQNDSGTVFGGLGQPNGNQHFLLFVEPAGALNRPSVLVSAAPFASYSGGIGSAMTRAGTPLPTTVIFQPPNGQIQQDWYFNRINTSIGPDSMFFLSEQTIPAVVAAFINERTTFSQVRNLSGSTPGAADVLEPVYKSD